MDVFFQNSRCFEDFFSAELLLKAASEDRAKHVKHVFKILYMELQLGVDLHANEFEVTKLF